MGKLVFIEMKILQEMSDLLMKFFLLMAQIEIN